MHGAHLKYVQRCNILHTSTSTLSKSLPSMRKRLGPRTSSGMYEYRGGRHTRFTRVSHTILAPSCLHDARSQNLKVFSSPFFFLSFGPRATGNNGTIGVEIRAVVYERTCSASVDMGKRRSRQGRHWVGRGRTYLCAYAV
jgi:hypothetical protein